MEIALNIILTFGLFALMVFSAAMVILLAFIGEPVFEHLVIFLLCMNQLSGYVVTS